MLLLLSHQPVTAMPAISSTWASTSSGTVTAPQRRTSQKVSQQSATRAPSFASELATNGNSVFRETPSATYLTAKERQVRPGATTPARTICAQSVSPGRSPRTSAGLTAAPRGPASRVLRARLPPSPAGAGGGGGTPLDPPPRGRTPARSTCRSD